MSVYQVVATAGTSALSESNYFGERLRRDYNDRVTVQGFSLRTVKPGEEPQAVLADVLSQLRQSLPAGDTVNPQKISAEFSLIHAMIAQRALSQKARVTLLRTDTLEGWFAAELSALALETYLDVSVTVKTLPDVDVHDARRMQLGIAATMRAISDELRQHDAQGTAFSPIGGYKIMTALSYAVASLHGYSSVYLHELGQLLHTIPPMPVAIDPNAIAELGPLVRNMLLSDDGFSTEMPADSPEWASVSRFPWFFERIDTLLGVSSFGLYVFHDSAYRHALWPRVLVKSELRRDWHLVGSILAEEIESIVEKLQDSRSEREGSIFHELEWRKQVPARDCHWHLLKRPRASERFLWRACPKTGAIFVGSYWNDHKKYEQNVAQALRNPFPGPQEFEDVTELVYNSTQRRK